MSSIFTKGGLRTLSQVVKDNGSSVVLATVTAVTGLGFAAAYYNAMDPTAHEIVTQNNTGTNNKNIPKKKNHRDLAEEILMYGVARCQGYYHDHYYPFDTQEFPEVYTPAIPVRPQAPSVFTIAVAPVTSSTFLFKKQTLFKIAVALPSSSLDRAKIWDREYHTAERRGEESRPLSDYLLQKVNIVTPYEISNPLKVAITIRFLQTMSTDDFLQIIRDGFQGAPWRYTAYLEDALNKAISDEKIRSGEELAFYWFDNGELMVVKNGDVRGRIYKEGVNRRFLEVFVDNEHAICTELVKGLEDHIPRM